MSVGINELIHVTRPSAHRWPWHSHKPDWSLPDSRPSFVLYQIMLLGNKGICEWTTGQELLH